MSGRVVLVTGVSQDIGGRLAARLSRDPAVSRVVGIDVAPPDGDVGRTEYVRADIRNPIIAKVIAAASVDTVVHTGILSAPFGAGGRAAMKEINVIGTMQLLAACQKAPSVRRLVVKSTTAVYGCSPRDPALFTEEMQPRTTPRSGFAKDSVEVEGYVRGLGRRRPDIAVTMLRLTNVIGPRVDNALTRYLSLPVVPRVLGYDPRMQLLHVDDALDVLVAATTGDHSGTVNVAGDGVLLLSQAIRRTGRPAVPVPAPAVAVASSLARRTGFLDVSAEQVQVIEHGRGVDISRLRSKFPGLPRYSTAEALADFVAHGGVRPVIDPAKVAAAETGLRRLALRVGGLRA